VQCNRVSIAVAIEEEPVGATSAIKAALATGGACIVSAEQLGNQGLVFGFEITAGQLPALLGQLRHCARLLSGAEAAVERLVYELQPDIEVHGMLHVSLVHGAADERVPRPRVPG
jgi:hypothetical protein